MAVVGGKFWQREKRWRWRWFRLCQNFKLKMLIIAAKMCLEKFALCPEAVVVGHGANCARACGGLGKI